MFPLEAFQVYKHMSYNFRAPKISVCITTYQHALYIQKCIESVLCQLFDGVLEILIGDDGSVDGAREIINLFARDERAIVKIFHHSERLGPSKNLRFLVDRAEGDLIAHVDGDDFWLPEKLQMQISELRKHPEIVAIYSNAIVVGEDGGKIGVFNRGVPARVNARMLLRNGNFLNHSTLMYRKCAVDAILGINGEFIDYRVHIRFTEYGALGYVGQPLVAYRWRTQGSMISQLPELVYQGHLDAFREASLLGVYASDVRAGVSVFWGKLLVRDIMMQDFKHARMWALRIVRDDVCTVTTFYLFIASLLAFPKALISILRRRLPLGGDRVFFP